MSTAIASARRTRTSSSGAFSVLSITMSGSLGAPMVTLTSPASCLAWYSVISLDEPV